MDKSIGMIRTAVGKKLLVAATGLVLLLFLVGHVTGNLKAFLGNNADGVPEIDVYGQFLRTVGEPAVPAYSILWLARVVLLTCLVVHVILVIQLASGNLAARPIRYVQYHPKAASWTGRTMMVSGVLLLIFVVFHILHFTTGTIRLGKFEHGQVYSNLYYSFRQPLVSLLYIGFMLVVGMHVHHGTWSFFQTWGLDSPDRNKRLRQVAIVVAVGLLVGFSLVPLAFMSGVMPLPGAR